MIIGRRFIILLVAMCFITSCASNAAGFKKESQLELYLVGISQEEIISTLGAPVKKRAISDGSEVWTYNESSIGLRGGRCVIDLSFRDGRVETAKVNSTDWSPLSYPLGGCKIIVGKLLQG